jgi:hypothetical protein
MLESGCDFDWRVPVRTAALILFALICLGRAGATTISYTESITTDGSLGGTAFTGELVTLTFTADTSNVTFFQGSGFTRYTNIPSSSTVTVAGIGTATFSDPISLLVEVHSTFSEFGATDTSIGQDILDTFAVTSGFAGYNMQVSLAPVSGGAAYPVGTTTFGTSLGSFEFTKSGGGVSSVSAATTVPELSSLGMLATGLCSVAVLRRNRRERQLKRSK